MIKNVIVILIVAVIVGVVVKFVFLDAGQRSQKNNEGLEENTHTLVIETNPPQTDIKIVNINQDYTSDMELKEGNYEIQILKQGYKTYQQTVFLDQDMKIQVNLEPVLYKLNVNVYPPDAYIKVNQMVYAGEISVKPGEYIIEVNKSGYKAFRQSVLVNEDKIISINLENSSYSFSQPTHRANQDYSLTVVTRPVNTKIELADSNIKYYPGIQLPAGEYIVEVSKEGFQAQRVKIPLYEDQIKEIELFPASAHLGIITTPKNAKVEIVNLNQEYISNMKLAPGRYKIRVTELSHKPYEAWIELKDSMVKEVVLEPVESYVDPHIGLKFVTLKKGCFWIGSPPIEANRYPDEQQVQTCIENDFYISTTEVTNKQFRMFKPDHFSLPYDGEDLSIDNLPVSYVSWYDAVDFAEWLSLQAGGEYDYRLPTEAEWEYAAKAGSEEVPWFWGEDIEYSCDYANSWDGSSACKDGYPVASPVGSFQANAWGLYDMLGNVWEWTCSSYASKYDGNHIRCADKKDNRERVSRGGSWKDSPSDNRLAYRFHNKASNLYANRGFRLVRVVPKY